ncbi:MAG: porin [Xanthobacteraceae bacterium]|nr:porin [Xanthobacteraceae bacterium]
MKTVIKNVLLGSVAGLAMVGTAAAADLPVKAKAAEYVKICSTYGAGYYYIPGTDTCLKIGGYVTADFYVQGVTDKGHIDVDHFGPGGPSDLDFGFDDSDTQSYFKTRTAIQLDARTQTEYGTLRSYTEVRWTYGNADADAYADGNEDVNVLRIKYAYIQFAGFTFGKATSAFDFWAGDFYEGIDPGFFYSDATPNQIAYTADFGNGFSATISIEDAYERSQDFFDDGSNVFGENRQEVPDIVANITYEGSWGAAKIAGALHDLNAQYDTIDGFDDGDFDLNDDWGWAVLAGIRFDIAETTTIYVEGAYADGALGYLGFGATNGTLAAGLSSDENAFDTFGTGASVDAVGDSISGWYVGGGIRHFWTPTVFTSAVGSYGETDKYTAFIADNFRGDDGFAITEGKTKVYSLAANIGWRPVKGLQFVLQYDRVYEEFDFNGDFFDDIGPINDDAVFSGNEKTYTDRFMFEAKRSF